MVSAFDLYENAEKIDPLLAGYIESGGLCETFNLSKEQIAAYRNSLMDKILLKDVIGRYRIDRSDKIKNLLLYHIRNLGSLTSFSALGKAASIDDKTASTYTEYLCNTFALQRLDKFEWKSKRVFSSMKKIYAGDQLFTHLCRETRQLENLVFLHLCRYFGRENVCFLRDERGHEVDFLVTRDRSFDCYQVCHFLTDDNAEREFRPLLRLLKDNADANDQENRFCVIYLKDLRKDKTNPEQIKLVQIAEFLLFDSRGSP
jgi:predicted AAA+ superfamily ATPase